MTDATPGAPTTAAAPTLSSRDQWLADRRKVITGTDLAALFDVGYKGTDAMSVWLDKTGRAPVATIDNDAMRFGRRFERPILEEYADREQVPLLFADSHQLVTSPEFPCIGATLDATRTDNGHPVDAKNIGYRTAEYGEDGSDLIPLKFMLQLTAQMMVTKADAAVLAVLFNRYEFCRYPMQRDPIVVERIHERAERFMTEHVKADTPPPVDGSAAWTAWLGSHLKQRTKTMLAAGATEHEFAVSLHDTLGKIKYLEQEADALRNHLKLAIGEAGGMEAPDWKITWTQSKDRTKIDWEAVAKEFGAPPDSAIYRDTVAKHTTTSPGSRAFRFSFRSDD